MQPIRIALLLAAAAVCPGCGDDGPPTGTASGTVKIGGAAPVRPIRVQFFNDTNGAGSSGTTEPNGEYELENPLPVGEYKVYFAAAEIPGATEGAVSTAQEEQAIDFIPKEYRNETGTPLVKTINEGSNTIDLDVPKKSAGG